MFALLVRIATLALLPLLGAAAAQAQPSAQSAGTALRFGVLNQRSPQLIAQYWNPILEHVAKKSGVPLELRIGKTAPDTTAMAVRGELDLYYTNHLFTVERDALGWTVFGRGAGESIRAAIVVAADSPLHSLAELKDRRVAFPSREAFLGYWVPMDALLRGEVDVASQFAGNQEGAMAQLRSGAADAAAVNAKVLAEYAQRVGLRTRALWTSEPYLELALMASPQVSADKVARLRAAFVGMARDPEGARLLEAAAALIGQKPPFGFAPAENRDYDNYRRFYRTTPVRVQAP
jgi:phosphonate transport system substrate-binding protein